MGEVISVEPFKNFKGIVATLDRANVDTDQIIPKQFLKSIKRTGFGKNLFFDWRYLPDGKSNPEFILNQERFRDASILVVRNNFGCGSSREHAVWAIRQDGYRAVVAPWVERSGNRMPGFADIFKNNCAKNALLTIELTEVEVEQIFQLVSKKTGIEATVDLGSQKIILHTTPEQFFKFEMDPAVKDRLQNGYDDIGITLTHEARVASFETKHNPQLYQS